MYKAETKRATQNKEITVTNLSSKEVVPKPGQTFKAFTTYTIQGNDGVNYETNDRDFFKTASIGKSIKIDFYVETKTVGGRIWTHYRIVPPERENPILAKQKAEILIEMAKIVMESETRMKEFIRLEILGVPSDTPKADPTMVDEIDENEDFSDAIPFD